MHTGFSRRFGVALLAFATALPALAAERDQPAATPVPAAASADAAAPSPATTPTDAAVEAPAASSSLFKDPVDGKFDMSRWLLEHKGFLPVPILVSDPALGYGGGLATVFFHRPEGAATTRMTANGHEQLISPDIYAAFALKTENGSTAYGAGASLHFDDDRWRYLGGAARSDFNLDFYPQLPMLDAVAIGYSANGLLSLQRVSRRIGNQELFLGLQWIYMDLDIGFDVDSDRDQFTPKELGERTSGLGLSLQMDRRDNPFTPNRGWFGTIEGNVYDGAIGSDADFQNYRIHVFGYLPLGNGRFVLGGRVDTRWANGDIPFYRLPFIDLRGIGSARYQDTRAAVVESELRWNATPRWALVGFAGAGRTWGRRNSYGDALSRVSKGAGVRYKIASMLGLYVGLDYAWGPEDETLYVQVGSAWR